MDILTWLSCSKNGPISLQDGAVDSLLVFSELPIGREGASDVRGIAVVLPSHVEQTEEGRTDMIR